MQALAGPRKKDAETMSRGSKASAQKTKKSFTQKGITPSSFYLKNLSELSTDANRTEFCTDPNRRELNIRRLEQHSHAGSVFRGVCLKLAAGQCGEYGRGAYQVHHLDSANSTSPSTVSGHPSRTPGAGICAITSASRSILDRYEPPKDRYEQLWAVPPVPLPPITRS